MQETAISFQLSAFSSKLAGADREKQGTYNREQGECGALGWEYCGRYSTENQGESGVILLETGKIGRVSFEKRRKTDRESMHFRLDWADDITRVVIVGGRRDRIRVGPGYWVWGVEDEDDGEIREGITGANS